MTKVQGPKVPNQNLVRRLTALQEISAELIKARDPHNLLNLVVERALDLLESDAGSLYLKGEGSELIFEVCLNRTVEIDFEKKSIPINYNGIANYCFNTGLPLNIKDVYKIAPEMPYAFDRSYDQQMGYRTMSTLTFPLQNSQEEILGVIQIINRKLDPTRPWPSQDDEALSQMPAYATEDEQLLKSFASLASAAIENAGLYKSINNLLEGFVHASVQAIESRDLATSGHSERVAILTTTLAENVSNFDGPLLKQIKFTEQQLREIRYASLLHDFGKIGVKEEVLLKPEKLYQHQKISMEARLKEFAMAGEIKFLREYIHQCAHKKSVPTELEIKRIEREIKNFREKIEDHWKKILQLNTCTVLDKDNSDILNSIKDLHYHNHDGHSCPLIAPTELNFLSIKRGSLSESERNQINEHVTHTYHFLKQIPWTKEFPSLLEIAYTHHEKLDGTGYPRGIKSAQIPVQAKIMAICDIFDALVANDRPYKKAVPFEKALDILSFEAKEGKLDKNLLQVFIDSKVFHNADFLSIINGPKKEAA